MISKLEQITALLTGRISELIAAKYGEAVLDVKPYVTVTRVDLEEFLDNHQAVAEEYYGKLSGRKPLHDTDMIGLKDGRYFVSWNDHGRSRFEKLFSTLPAAVAYHVLVTYGMSVE